MACRKLCLVWACTFITLGLSQADLTKHTVDFGLMEDSNFHVPQPDPVGWWHYNLQPKTGGEAEHWPTVSKPASQQDSLTISFWTRTHGLKCDPNKEESAMKGSAMNLPICIMGTWANPMFRVVANGRTAIQVRAHYTGGFGIMLLDEDGKYIVNVQWEKFAPLTAYPDRWYHHTVVIRPQQQQSNVRQLDELGESDHVEGRKRRRRKAESPTPEPTTPEPTPEPTTPEPTPESTKPGYEMLYYIDGAQVRSVLTIPWEDMEKHPLLNPESAMWATGDAAEVEIDSVKNKKNQETNAIMKNQVEAAWVNVVVGQAFTSEEINTDMLENAEDADLPTGLMATSAARIFVPFFKGTHYGSVFRYTDNQNYGNIAKPFCAYAANDPFAIAACTKASVTGFGYVGEWNQDMAILLKRVACETPVGEGTSCTSNKVARAFKCDPVDTALHTLNMVGPNAFDVRNKGMMVKCLQPSAEDGAVASINSRRWLAQIVATF